MRRRFGPRDRFFLWLARKSLREMSDPAAWWLFSAMRRGYLERPDLTGED